VFGLRQERDCFTPCPELRRAQLHLADQTSYDRLIYSKMIRTCCPHSTWLQHTSQGNASEQSNHKAVERLHANAHSAYAIAMDAIDVSTSKNRPASKRTRTTRDTIPATASTQSASRRHMLSAGIALCYWCRCKCLGASRRLESKATYNTSSLVQQLKSAKQVKSSTTHR